MFTLPSAKQYLSIIAHHLVIDLVSWRTILDDLEAVLDGKTLLDELPFQVWNALQAKQAQSSSMAPERVLSTEAHNELDFWNYTPATPNTFGDHIEESFEIDRMTTAILLKEANRGFNTEPVDLILTAIWDAFFQTFKSRDGLTIFNEGHGREPWSPDIDLSRTVGWFTTMAPLHVSRQSDSQREYIARVIKDIRRQLPSSGWAYFASRYLQDESKKAFKSHDFVMEVLFNYHGQFQQFESEDNLFENVSFNTVFDTGSEIPASCLFNINASIEAGLTKFTFSWNRFISHQDLIRKWIAHVNISMQALCSLLSVREPSPTIVDYEFVNLDYKGLDELQRRILPAIRSEAGAVTDIYPCSPMVDGMLLSQIRDPGTYKTSVTYELRHGNGRQPLSINRLEKGWQSVIARHPALRSVFIEGVDKQTAFSQVVLDSHRGEVLILKAETRTEAIQLVQNLPAVVYRQLHPPHRLVLCGVQENGTIIAQIEMSHTLADGASTASMLEDWSKAYAGALGDDDLLETTRSFSRSLKNSLAADKMTYWKNKLAHLEPCFFPRVSEVSQPGHNMISTVCANLDGDKFMRIQNFCGSQSITLASLFQSAWALTVAAYTGNDSVCFGYIASGRDLPIAGIAEAIGAYANILVCRAEISRLWTPQQFVQRIHSQVLEDLNFQHYSLADIQHDLEVPTGDSLFNTIVSFQKDDTDTEDLMAQEVVFVDVTHEDPTEYDISLGISCARTQVSFSLDCRLSCLTEKQAAQVISLLETIIISIVDSKPELDNLASLQVVSPNDIEQIWNWNFVVPETVNALVHDIISQTAKRFPEAPAICAWDGDWTYQQLDNISNRLAHELINLDVGPEKVVPLCFEKSRWMPVAMLAVMKAGGISVSLDTSLPEERMRTIVHQVSPTIILSSSTNVGLAGRLCTAPVFEVNESSLTRLDTMFDSVTVPSTVKPSNTLYIVFTSGSTGTPKGVTISHSNFSSSLRHQKGAYNFVAGARVYDFASYAFDVSWENVLRTLECGACLCIPSETERRNDLAGSLERFQVTHGDFTPSVAQLIPDRILGRLDTLILAGEALSPELAKHWATMVNVKNSYGPSECTPTTLVATMSPDNVNVASIGRGIGVNTWIVNSGGDYLAPIGSIGELYLEGPLVGPGYLGDPERTILSFVENPSWLLHGSTTRHGRQGRLYRTGDLVRYRSDGSLVFVGRKDSQVKINGQRVELGDVEYYIRSNITYDHDVRVVVEVVKPKDTKKCALVAFLSTEKPSTDRKVITHGLSEKLASQLPAYMIPSAYIMMESIPTTTSGKTDRGKLRAMGKQLTTLELMAYGPTQSIRREPVTLRESQLQGLWSTVLGLPRNVISSEDSFLRIGGDSIGAMRLVSLARDIGLSISVTDVFRNPRLSDLAKVAGNSYDHQGQALMPFSLLGKKLKTSQMQAHISQLCRIDEVRVEDAFPCTPLQEGLLAMTARRSGDYVAQNTFQLQHTVDISRFQQAWEHVMLMTPILRTRIVNIDGEGLVQVIIRENEHPWSELTSTTLYQHSDREKGMGMGTPLMRYAITKDAEDCYSFIWTVHHALYDGWSMPLVLERLEMAYKGTLLQRPPEFQEFVNFIRNVNNDDIDRFWTSQFEHLDAKAFPTLPSPVYQPRSNTAVSHSITGLSWPNTDSTPSTTIRAALSILIATHFHSLDALFGVTVTGRQAPVNGIEEMTGPTIATVPIHVSVDKESTVDQFLQQVQTQTIEMVPYEQTGLQKIRRINPCARQACEFQTLLIINPIEDSDRPSTSIFVEEDRDANESADESFADFDVHALTIECDLSSTGVLLRFRFDSSVIEKHDVENLGARLELVLRQLCDPNMTERKISDIDVVSSRDLDTIWDWNAVVPETVHGIVHELIAKNALKYPDSQAVCAWDGNWTYQELDDNATIIAHNLVGLGVGPDVIVPLYFEKSRWTPIAIMAVMKAGGASVLLDPTLPHDRLRSIVQQVDPLLIISSSSNQALAEGLTDKPTMVLGEGYLEAFNKPLLQALPKVNPWNKLYLVFTSGSTGVPKGATITHSNFSSAIRHQQATTGFSRSSRVFDFTKYAFDVSWSNFLHTMAAGGCLCIPRQEEALGSFAESVRTYKANFADITPSVATVLKPADLGGLEAIAFSGEALTNHAASQWAKYTRVINMYGPAECTVKSTWAAIDGTGISPAASIGHGLGVCTWVVDPSNHSRLAPVGAIGELLLEGPTVGVGYLNDAEKTAEVFIQDTPWLLRGGGGHQGRSGRLYKTGDLVQYSADGSLTFIARKDSQVKINGQRLELGDVEHNLATSIRVTDSEVQLAAEVITPRDSSKAMLVAFLQSNVADALESEMRRLTAGLNERLATKVPGYMIPSAYVMFDKLPLGPTGKLDRRQLRAMAEKSTWSELTASSSLQKERQPPSSPMELCLQKLWASVLDLDVESIYANDSFFDLGGDSIQAMKLATKARSHGLLLAVTDILTTPKLSGMASKLRRNKEKAGHAVVFQPFSLLPPGSQPTVEHHLVEYGISPDSIQDILPVTDQQARYILSTYTTARSAIYYLTLDRDDMLDIGRLNHTWACLMNQFDILRTAFIAYKDMFLQVVLKGLEVELGVFETKTHSLDEYTLKLKKQDLLQDLQFGKPVTKLSVIHQTREQKYRVVIRLSHAQYDGISMGKMWTAFENAYNSAAIPEAVDASFSQYIYTQSLLDKADTTQYWRNLLRGSTLTPIKSQRSHRLGYGQGPNIVKTIPMAALQSGNFTFATVLKAAWSYVLAKYSATNDVLFGSFSHGRIEPGAQHVVGPCVNMVPFRVVFEEGWSARDLVAAVHKQHLAGMPFETMGSREIIRNCTDWPKWSFFSSVILHQNFESHHEEEHSVDFHSSDLSSGDVDNVQLYITSVPGSETMEIAMGFGGGIISHELAHQLACDLRETLVMFYGNMDEKLEAPYKAQSMPARLPLPADVEITRALSRDERVMLDGCPPRLKESLGSAWGDVLGIPTTPGYDSLETLFSLGGDANNAGQLAAHLQRQGYRIRIEDVFENPTWPRLLVLLMKQQQSSS